MQNNNILIRSVNSFFGGILKKNTHGLINMGDRMREHNQSMREQTKKFFEEISKKFR